MSEPATCVHKAYKSRHRWQRRMRVYGLRTKGASTTSIPLRPSEARVPQHERGANFSTIWGEMTPFRASIRCSTGSERVYGKRTSSRRRGVRAKRRVSQGEKLDRQPPEENQPKSMSLVRGNRYTSSHESPEGPTHSVGTSTDTVALAHEDSGLLRSDGTGDHPAGRPDRSGHFGLTRFQQARAVPPIFCPLRESCRHGIVPPMKLMIAFYAALVVAALTGHPEVGVGLGYLAAAVVGAALVWFVVQWLRGEDVG